MPDLYRRHNPLFLYGAAMSGAQPGLRLSSRVFDGKIVLQGDLQDEGFKAASGEALLLNLPQPLASASRPGLGILGLGPREWLVVTPEGSEEAIYKHLQEVLMPYPHGLAIVSDAYSVITVAGPRARDILAAGCALDFHPRVYQTGRVVRTLLARISVIIHRAADHSYDLYVGRSYANYLASWMTSLKLG